MFAVAIIVQGTPPKVNDSGEVIVQWMKDHHEAARWAGWFALLATPLFVLFGSMMREVLGGFAGRTFLLGVVAVAILTSGQSWILLGLARRPGSLDPATARTLLDIANYWGPSLIAFTVLTLGPIAHAGLRSGRLPRWVGLLAAATLVEQLVESITVFGTSGFVAAGGPMNALLGAGLTLIVWLVAGIVAAGRSDTATA